ncbi:uncharacterized protein [Arachis hypogaea]|uniref:uncharacterized protein n=1 Tax=Arachis hypogaea TaxID=3818 RepID=UPI0011056FBE|nr:uncharacterized protein LOC114925940 [Arachis hypogaea]
MTRFPSLAAEESKEAAAQLVTAAHPHCRQLRVPTKPPNLPRIAAANLAPPRSRRASANTARNKERDRWRRGPRRGEEPPIAVAVGSLFLAVEGAAPSHGGCRCSRRCYCRREPWLEEGARDQGRGVSRFASVESALPPPLLGFHRRRPRGGWCRHKRRPPELLSASASGLCKLPEPTAARAAQNHHCGCRWDCEWKKETLVLSQPFPGEKSVAPPCLAAGKCHCRRRKIMMVPAAA